MLLGKRDVQLGYFAALKGRIRAERSARMARECRAKARSNDDIRWWHVTAERLESLARDFRLEMDYAPDAPWRRA